jgi:hypothetical protein
MDARRCDFLLLAALAMAAAMPAAAQGVLPAGAPADHSHGSTQDGAPIPDFSGVWAHLTWPDFEPPAAGPGPVGNRSHRNGASDVYELVGDYASPILKPHAAEIVKHHGEISLTGEPYPTPSNQCWPGGVPFVLFNIGMQMLQEPDKITFLYSNDHEVRHVRLNAPHPAQVTPSWYGDSVGHYEGDTLVIDTVASKTDRPFPMIDLFGTPYTKALHVVERYRLLDHEAVKDALERGAKENQQGAGAIDRDYEGKFLQIHLTIEDKGAFTTPWTATVTYARDAREWPEIACAENIHEYYYNKNSEVPHADRPDF